MASLRSNLSTRLPEAGLQSARRAAQRALEAQKAQVAEAAKAGLECAVGVRWGSKRGWVGL